MCKIKGQRGCGKDYLTTLKCLKSLCIQFFGLGFIFATPKVRAFLLESMNEFINDLSNSFQGHGNDKIKE